MIGELSHYLKDMTPARRMEDLYDVEDSLRYNTRLKFQFWCGTTNKPLSEVQERVLAEVWWVFNPGETWYPSPAVEKYLMRWLMAHTGPRKYEFNVKKAGKQWPRIISHYFSANGHYGELAILEKILLTILRSKKPTILKDIFPADRHADLGLWIDWIMELDKNLRLGIQVGTGSNMNSKLKKLIQKHPHDRDVIKWKNTGKKSDEEHLSHDFVRDGSAVMLFPTFKTDKGDMSVRKADLLAWKRTYQTRHITEQNPSFVKYGRWIMDILDFLDRGIKSDFIHMLDPRTPEVSQSHITNSGDTVFAKVEKFEGQVVATLELHENTQSYRTSRPIRFALPISPGFLKVYKEKMGS